MKKENKRTVRLTIRATERESQLLNSYLEDSLHKDKSKAIREALFSQINRFKSLHIDNEFFYTCIVKDIPEDEPLELNQNCKVIKCKVIDYWLDDSNDDITDNLLNGVRIIIKLQPAESLPDWYDGDDYYYFDEVTTDRVYYTEDAAENSLFKNETEIRYF